MAETPKDPRSPSGEPVPASLASATAVATRRTSSGVFPVPQKQAEPLKPTIAEALAETKEAVQEAVRELTGKVVIPVAVVTPTAQQIRQADAAAAAQTSAPQAGQGDPKGTPPPTDMVTLKIDGQTVQVKKGTNLLEACLQQGTDISYFCYHKGLSAPAVCRQCLVEVVGQHKLVPSCYTPVADKMEVVTKSARVAEVRQQMLEFTLVNHPVDCPICDKAGECHLQKLYMEYDGKDSRTDVDKVHKPKVVDLGPTIVLDAERCILCTRCIRVCDEVAGEHQLEISWRGDRAVLGTANDKKLDNPYSLNTVDVCPVGALTSKDFRFRMRAWELYTVDSVCPGCATGCNVEVHHHQGEVWRLVPRENQQINKFWMCDEGRMTYKEVKRQRIAGARFGAGRGMPGQISTVEKAVAYAADRLSRICDAKGTIGLCFGAQAQNEALFGLAQVAEALAAQGLPVRRYLTGRAHKPERADKILRHADTNPNSQGARIFASSSGPVFEFADLLKDLKSGTLKALWMVGEDLPSEDGIVPLLDNLDLFVVQAVHDTPASKRAQVILPAAAWAEVDGTFTTAKGEVQRIRKAVEPAGAARSHLELVNLLSQKAGLCRGHAWQGSPKQAFLHMTAVLSAQVPADTTVASPLRGFSVAEWGRERPPLQLRFANSRG